MVFGILASVLRKSGRCIAVAAALAVAAQTSTLHGQAASPDSVITLAERTDLARLVDLCAQQLSLRLEYDEKVLSGNQVTLRLDTGLTATELWDLTNDLLASRNFTTIRTTSGILRVVPLAQAADLAPLESIDSPPSLAGYARRLIQIKHATASSAVERIKPLLSKNGKASVVADRDGLIAVADLTSWLGQVEWLIDQIDVPEREVAMEPYVPQFVSGAELHSHVTAAVAERNALLEIDLKGSVKPSPAGNSLILVAPSDSLEEWREIIARFDRRQPVERRTYAASGFPMAELAPVVEQSARIDGPRGSGDQWKVVEDRLTGMLIVTATAAEHLAISELMDRLAALPNGSRQPVRSFRIRNRSVDAIQQVLTSMVDSGMLDADITAIDAPTHGDDGEGGGIATAAPSRPSSGDDHTPRLLITTDAQTSMLIAMGDPHLLNEVEALIRVLDVREPQVKIEVLLVALSESDTLDLGVELQKLEVRGSTLFNLSSLFGLGSPALSMGGSGGESDGSPSATGPRGTGFTGLALSPGDFSVVIRALENVNQGRVLSMPFVTVNNNFNATFDSVLEEPYTQTNASNTVATTSLGGTSQAGTQVTVTPQIAAGDHLILEYTVSLSTFVGESSDPSLPPPRQQNSLSSQVTIPDGYTIAVGGIELVNEAEAQTTTPVLSDIPLFGWLFRSESTSSSRTRFYVFIRANVLRHNGFEDLKYLSERDLVAAGIEDDTWPKVEPRLIR